MGEKMKTSDYHPFHLRKLLQAVILMNDGLTINNREKTYALLEAKSKVAPNHRGASFLNLVNKPDEFFDTRLELAMAALWSKRNDASLGVPLLIQMLNVDKKLCDERINKILKNLTEKEMVVAQIVAATVIQWFGTRSGTGFIMESVRDAGLLDLKPADIETQE